MQTNDHDRKGEFRCLRPEEIGNFVANCRKRAGWNQLTLAFEAKIHERTVQRMERGEKVDDDTLCKVAKALRLEEEAFLGPHYISTEDEAIAKAEKILSEIKVIEAHAFATLKDCDAVLRAHG